MSSTVDSDSSVTNARSDQEDRARGRRWLEIALIFVVFFVAGGATELVDIGLRPAQADMMTPLRRSPSPSSVKALHSPRRIVQLQWITDLSKLQR